MYQADGRPWVACCAIAVLILVLGVSGGGSDWRTIGAVFGLVFVVACTMFGRAARLGRDLVSIDEAAERLGIQELSLLLDRRRCGIEPECIINGKEYYRLADLGDAAILLRPASPTEETLLRPAGSADSAHESLLRSTSAPGGEPDE